MAETYNNFYSDRQSIIDAVTRDATYLWVGPPFVDSDTSIPSGYNSYSTISNVATLPNHYHVVDEIKPLATLVEQTTGKTISQCWGNIEGTDQWIGRHVHAYNQSTHITMIATYYAQVIRGELLYFETDSTTIESISLAENRLITFDSTLPHGFKPRVRARDKITVTFELI